VVVGGTGYIGSAIVEAIARRGDSPVVVSPSAPDDLPPGAEARTGDARDPEALATIVGSADAVIYAAAPMGDWDADTVAVSAIMQKLAGTDRPFVYTSGIWSLGAAAQYAGEPADDDAATDALPISIGRPALERLVVDAAAEGIRTATLRPGIVYGRAGGIPSMLVGWARENGSGRYVGSDPGLRWPMVHVDDLADAYLLVLDRGRAGSLVNVTAQDGVAVGSLAEAADRAAGGSGVATSWAYDDAVETLGKPFADALVHDQVISSPRVRALGWTPRHVDAVADLAGEPA
ncbi:MAG: NAD-dependent epimerase/dehydratase family protein, partial [Actinomycetia bacterium]|nr:NAD-dependent epimerase/dehydratase family protein [Actinomycetes bacterium]